MSVTVNKDLFQAAETDFKQEYPAYASTALLDTMREAEYSRLDDLDHVYLDYTGGGLYAASQLRAHQDLLAQNVFGNPHSQNPTSKRMTDLVESARSRVLEFFQASPDEYAAIFTSNASNALKLVGESYPFGPGDHYLMAFDNHNSVNGIREYARCRGARLDYIPLGIPDMRVPEEQFSEAINHCRTGANDLFAFPAQSNFSGVQHPLEWIPRAQEKGWDVLLDAAAFVPTNRLDLSVWKPDFVALAFYKMFGYPTGIGALIAKRSALAKLRRPWFAGGTITVASVQGDRHYMADGEAAFEDGTVNYLNIPAIEVGLNHLDVLGMERIHERCRCLTGWLIERLVSLTHRNGERVVQIYGPESTDHRGGTVTMNFYSPEGAVVDHVVVEDLAADQNISLRTGCFCNPGGGEVALDLTRNELVGCFSQPHIVQSDRFTVDDFRLCVDGKSTGAVRVSVGLASTFKDVYRFWLFTQRLSDRGE